MQRPASYGYPQYPAAAPPQKQYPAAHSTSSAFSASANPNEDWTKISDLAERRRIQNRIAQRNYRKKLKKRLENLERRAGSSSASPEQRHEELPEPEALSLSQASSVSPSHRGRSNSSQSTRERTPDILAQQYSLPTDDRGMFSQQYTRQLSTSPPPFSYASMPPTEGLSYSAYHPTAASYCSLPSNGSDMPLYPQFAQHMPQTYAVPSMTSPPIKQEYYGDDDEINPFSMSYASMSSYQDMPPVTPPLSDTTSEHWLAGSPPDHPRTPEMFGSTTPPLGLYEHS